MDGREATLEVRQYFEASHGMLSVIRFQVHDVRFNAAGNQWEVRCSFFEGPYAKNRAQYKVIVDDANGEIRGVEQLDPVVP